MSYQSIALVVLGAWLAIGVVLGVVMERRGYSGFGWGVIGAVLGPVGVLVALFVHLPPHADETLRFGISGPGPIDVLVGTDGSDVSIAAALGVTDVLGSRIGRLTLARVEPIDATPEEEASGRGSIDAALHALARSLQPLGVRPGAIVLHGHPAFVLKQHAIDEGYEVLAVGSHGRGASQAILGSTASALVRTSPVPVFVAGHAAAQALGTGAALATTSS